MGEPSQLSVGERPATPGTGCQKTVLSEKLLFMWPSFKPQRQPGSCAAYILFLQREFVYEATRHQNRCCAVELPEDGWHKRKRRWCFAWTSCSFSHIHCALWFLWLICFIIFVSSLILLDSFTCPLVAGLCALSSLSLYSFIILVRSCLQLQRFVTCRSHWGHQ